MWRGHYVVGVEEHHVGRCDGFQARLAGTGRAAAMLREYAHAPSGIVHPAAPLLQDVNGSVGRSVVDEYHLVRGACLPLYGCEGLPYLVSPLVDGYHE